MIKQIYEKCFEVRKASCPSPNSLIQDIEIKKNVQIVFKKDKGWIFDYENSVLFTLTKVAALGIYAIQEGNKYDEIVSCISQYFKAPPYIVDSDFQELFAEMFKLNLLKINEAA